MERQKYFHKAKPGIIFAARLEWLERLNNAEKLLLAKLNLPR